MPDLDRFARSMVKGLVLEEQLRGYGVRVLYQRVPVEDTPEGPLLKNQLFTIAEYEREKTRLRTMTGARQKARSGQVVGISHAPYGYRYTYIEKRGRMVRSGLEPDLLTAPIVRRIYERLLTRTLIQVAEELNAEGIPGPRGGRWHDATIRNMVKNPVYVGIWQFGRKRQPCSCGHPHSARKLGKPVCDLPGVNAAAVKAELCVNAAAVKAELWARLSEAVLDADNLRAGLEPARAAHEDADRLRRDRLEIVTAGIGKQRCLDELAGKLVDASGAVYDALMRQANDIAERIERFERERANLERMRVDGPTAADAEAIEAFARRAAVSLEIATPRERRELLEQLRIQGRVYLDPGGVKLGRRHSYRVDWRGLIPIPDTATSSLIDIIR